MEAAGRLIYVALVTVYVLGLILPRVATPGETVVCAVAAALGLEYVAAVWGDLWRRG